MQRSVLQVVAAFALSPYLTLTRADEFLRAETRTSAEHISADEVRMSLFKEIESSLPQALGTSSASKRYAELEATLKPIYTALPKNRYGRVEHTAASYALHRLFVARHGWFIRGLGPVAGTYSDSSPAEILKDQVPSYIENLFHQRLGGKGFELHDLAALAATIEHLIHDETVNRFGSAFRMHDVDERGAFDFSAATEVLDTFMAGHILGENLTGISLQAAKKIKEDMPGIYTHWRDTRDFVQGVLKETLTSGNHRDYGSIDSIALSKVAEAVGEQFGTFFQDKVCKKMKNRLMQLEHQNSGRVKLSQFYRPGVRGDWQFQESVSYLREAGAFEESVESGAEPSIMIANYMAGPSNCIASSGFYAVCCKNECEDLLGTLEGLVGASEAQPGFIAALVAFTPSSSTRARGALPTKLRRRLDEVAEHHAGMVPLHSRLFAQWLHHAYPRECPYPHLSGTTSSKLPEEWLEDKITASRAEMLLYSDWKATETIADEDVIPWSTTEELILVSRPTTAPASPIPNSDEVSLLKRRMVLFVIAAWLAVGLIQTVKATNFGYSDACLSPKFGKSTKLV